MDTKFYTLITGSTGGLGNSFVKCAISLGHNLFLTSTKQQKLDDLKSQILSINPNINIITFKCDFLLDQDIDNLVQYIKDNSININYLINNAGYIIEGSNQNMSFDDVYKCVKVNNLSTLKLTREIINLHTFSEPLNIITIGSMAGNYPLPYMSIYSASKAFLKNYMLAIREENRKNNIRLLLVEPGAIATSDTMKQAIKAQGLKGRLSAVNPDIIAKKAFKLVIKNKPVYVPGAFNKLTDFVSHITPQKLQIKVAGKMWKKSQAKRNIK